MYRISVITLSFWLLMHSGAAPASCSDAAFADAISQKPASVEEVLRNNLRAVRKDSAADAIRNMDAVIEIREAGYTLMARYRATADGFMRIDVFSEDDRVFSEGKDEHGVWEWPGGVEEPENVHHEGVGALEHGIEFNLFALAELPGRGHDVQLIGCDTIYDADYFVLKVTLSDGFETYRYVNAETRQVDLSRDFRAFHPGIDATKKHLETRYDEWQPVDGIIRATRSRNVDLETGEILATTLVLDSRFNVPLETLDLSRNYVPSGALLVGE